MIDWIIPLVVGALIAGGVLFVPHLMRSKFRGVNQQANNSKLDAVPTDPQIAPPDQNVVSDPKNWLRIMGQAALPILGQVAIGLVAGVFLLIIIALLLTAMLS